MKPRHASSKNYRAVVRAERGRVRRTAEGVLVVANGRWFELAADVRGAFRLSISAAGAPPAAATVFLRPASGSSAVAVRIVREDALVGIANATGALLVDPRTGAWTLRDGGGGILVRPLAAAATEAPPDPRAGVTRVRVGWPRDTPIRGYGSGNGTLALAQTEGRSEVGNGRAVIPFLWSPTGYAMLAVGEDDARPASWRGDAGRSRLEWTFPGRVAHLYLAPAPTLKDAARVLAELTGAAPVPPRWTFGYLQSRWGWKSRADLERVFREFRRRRFPVDAFILDFEWYTAEPDYEVPSRGRRDFPDFRANPKLFPDPARQLAEFHARGLRMVAIRKPRIGDTATLRALAERKWLLTFGPDAPRKWSVRELDFRRPELRRWYSERLRPLVEAGFDAWWNDEGESRYLTYFHWNEAELEVERSVRPRRRFWSLNRAFAPGMQRLGATAWTGDAYATWEALAATPTHLLNWGLAGMPYGGCDIGGFRGEVTPQLFVRWMQAGVFFPMMRAHTAVEWTPRFPWRFGRAAAAALRKALELRYRLVPYLYSLAHESHATGLPVMRPLAMEFPDDPLVANLSDQWLLGARLMAAPLLAPGTERRVYLPAGDWYRLGSGERIGGARVISVHAGLDEIPVFVRAGTILPLGPVVRSTAALPGGPLVVQVYPGADASFTLVEDDGLTTDYASGAVRRTTFRWDEARRVLSWNVEGSYDGPDVFREIRILARRANVGTRPGQGGGRAGSWNADTPAGSLAR